jgi:hypothetical protein
MEVHPQNMRERAFAIVTLVFAMVTFSSFVSSITNAMTQLRNMNTEYAKQLLKFQRYIRYHNVSKRLAVRLRRHLEFRLLRTDRHLDEKDVELIALLSEPLRMALHLEVHSGVLENRPFFAFYNEENPMALRKVCPTCIDEFSLSLGDLLFRHGDCSDRMFFAKGSRGTALHYHAWTGGRFLDESVYTGSWLSEATLWVSDWVHLGEAICAQRCSLLALRASAFHDVVQSSRSMKVRPSRYADVFVKHLNAPGDGQMTDLENNGFDYQAAIETLRDEPLSPTLGSQTSTNGMQSAMEAESTERGASCTCLDPCESNSNSP